MGDTTEVGFERSLALIIGNNGGAAVHEETDVQLQHEIVELDGWHGLQVEQCAQHPGVATEEEIEQGFTCVIPYSNLINDLVVRARLVSGFKFPDGSLYDFIHTAYLLLRFLPFWKKLPPTIT